MTVNIEERFNDLVAIAEKYIEENALKTVSICRQKEYKNCYDLVNSVYKPMYNLNDFKTENWKLFLLKRFCIQMQNYQAMPKAINYISYCPKADLSSDKNVIYEIAKNFQLDYSDTDTDKFYKICKEKINFEEKLYDNNEVYNYAWKRYSQSMVSVLKYLDNLKQDEFLKDLEIMNSLDFDNHKRVIDKITNNIFYLGETLTYDFFKEIGCVNLIKPDVHIERIGKELLGLDTNNLTKTFIELCLNYQKTINPNYTPYYIDKIIWLCCTGAFYEDVITIGEMKNYNFIEYYNNQCATAK